MWIVSPPRPEELRPLLDALLDRDRDKAWGLLDMLPKPWATAARTLPARDHSGPLPGLYLLADYCTWRSQRKLISPLERDSWLDLHQRAWRGMAVRGRGAPSKALAKPLRLSLKITYEQIREAIGDLRGRTPQAVTAIIRRHCDGGWRPSEHLIAEVLADAPETDDEDGGRGRTWEGLHKVLGAWVGVSGSEFRRQVVERSRESMGHRVNPHLMSDLLARLGMNRESKRWRRRELTGLGRKTLLKV